MEFAECDSDAEVVNSTSAGEGYVVKWWENKSDSDAEVVKP